MQLNTGQTVLAERRTYIDRRLGYERRRICYTAHIPERRKKTERRNGDRRQRQAS